MTISTATIETGVVVTGSYSYAVQDTALYSLMLQIASDIQTDGYIKISNVSIAQQYFVYKFQCLNITARMKKGTAITFQFNNASTIGNVFVTKLT